MRSRLGAVARTRRAEALAFARPRLFVAALLLIGAAAAVWPAATLAAALLVLVTVLAFREPAYGFVLVLVLFGFEGTLKEAFAAQDSFVLSATAAGALVLDVALLIAVVGLVVKDRGRSFVALWRNAGRAGRAGIALLVAWLAISVPQTLQGGDLAQGVVGFRLTQAYIAAAFAGAMLFAPLSRDARSRLTTMLLVGVGIVAAYAALRTLVGPSDFERDFALSRPGVTVYGDVFRAVGSFSGAVGLASYLVPTAVFAATLGVFSRRLRLLAGLVAVCALVGIVGTYARVGLVALAVGVVFGAALGLGARRPSRRQTLVVGGSVAAVLVLLAAATYGASRVSPVVETRANAFVDPLHDESLRIRVNTWEESLRAVGERPLGSGLGSVGRASDLGGEPAVTTDNSFLKVLREQGVF
ncbi:MAG: O-antigen ligase family protein, partial [Actinomycetota bacterium]